MLHLHRVAKLFGLKAVLRNVSCAFAPGSVTLLVGDNGAGKSTLLRMAAGLSRPSAGEIIRAEHAVVGYVGHATFLYPGLTALENLAFWARLYGVSAERQRLLDLLELVGLAAHAHERAGVFSRGMSQRLNLARVLMRPTDLLLLDEPGTGLDAASRALLREQMIAARNRGACVIVVSHDYADDSPAADRVVALRDGVVAYDGPPSGYVPGMPPEETAAPAAPAATATPERPEPEIAVPAASGEEPPAPGLVTMALSVARKDLLLTLARGSGLVQALLLGLLLLFVFSLAQGVGERLSPQNAAAVFWLSSAFCQVLVFNSLYALEERCASRVGLVLAPAPVQGVWLGKALAGMLLLLLAQLLFLPAAVVFLGQELRGDLPAALGILLLVDMGMCALGSLLGALAQGEAARESLLSILLFPLLIPLLLAGIGVGAQALGAPSPDGPDAWLGLAAAFDAVFAAAGLLLFGFMYTGDDA